MIQDRLDFIATQASSLRTAHFALDVINAYQAVHLPIRPLPVGLESTKCSPQRNVCTNIGCIVLLGVQIPGDIEWSPCSNRPPRGTVPYVVIWMAALADYGLINTRLWAEA